MSQSLGKRIFTIVNDHLADKLLHGEEKKVWLMKASVRAIVAHSFRVIKCQWGSPSRF